MDEDRVGPDILHVVEARRTCCSDISPIDGGPRRGASPEIPLGAISADPALGSLDLIVVL